MSAFLITPSNVTTLTLVRDYRPDPGAIIILLLHLKGEPCHRPQPTQASRLQVSQ